MLTNCGSQIPLELGGRQIAERGVEPFLVVDLLEKLANGAAGLEQIAIFVTMDLLILFMKDSQAALSQGLPLRDMLMSILFFFSRSV